MNDQIDNPRSHDEIAPDDAAQKEPLDEALIARALQQLQEVARGNGMMARQIMVAAADGEIHNFEGLSFFTIEQKSSEKRVPGRERGQVMGSATEMRARIQSDMDLVSKDPEVRRHTMSWLRKRKDMGVLAGGQSIALNKTQQSYVVHEACAPCAHEGHTTCNQCGGQGRTACKRCHGTKDMPCPMCRGTRFIATPKGQTPCRRCSQRGKVSCTQCRNSGFDQCAQCRGGGQIKCQNCAGTGWHSLLGALDLHARSHFEYDRTALPAAAAARLDKLAARAVVDGHLHAALIEDEARFMQLQQASKPAQYIIPYHLRLPVGTVTFTLPQKQEITAQLFGFNPVLGQMPPFLEKPLAPALDQLTQAATGRLRELRHAIRARFVAETIMTVLRHPRKKALRMLQKRYPVGLRTETIQETILIAEKVMKNVTAKPQMQGLGVGMILAGALYGGYFIGGLRPMAAAAVTEMAADRAAIMMDVIDALVYMTGIAAAVMIAQVLAAQGVRHALGALAERVPQAHLAPSVTKPLLLAAGMAALLFIGAAEATLWARKDVPHWYDWARAQVAAHINLPVPATQEAEPLPVLAGPEDMLAPSE